MRLTLDEWSTVPLSDQLATALGERILRGSLAPGTQLPTVRALAEDLGLAPNTVAKAYRALEEQGLVQGRGRQGTFVTDHLPERLPEREGLLEEAAAVFARRGTQLGFGEADLKQALRRAFRDLGSG